MTQVISTTLLHGDGSIEVVTSLPEAPELTGFALDGFSVDSLFGVCFRCEAIDIYRNELLAGDRYQIAAAADLPEWFCLVLPERDQSEDEIKLVRFNHNQDGAAWAYVTANDRMRFQEFYPAARGLDESQWGESAPANIVVPIGGVNPNDDYLTVASELIEDTETAITSARSRSPGQPKPGQGYSGQ